MKSTDLSETIPGSTDIRPPEPGHVWNDWPSEDQDVLIRYWSVHVLAVAEKQLVGDALDSWAEMAVVCFFVASNFFL